MKTHLVRLAFCFLALICLVLASQVQAGEYYIYHDPAGKVVISNQRPPAGSKIIKQETLPEVTNAQLEEARKRDDDFWSALRTEKANRLVWESYYAKPEQPCCIPSDTNIAIGVTQGFPLGIRRPFPYLPRESYVR